MVAEGRAELRQPLVDRGPARLGGLIEAGTGAVEVVVGALQEAHLLARQPQRGAVVVDQRDPAEQHRVHHDRVPVPRHPWRNLLVDREDFWVGVGRDQIVENRRDLREQLSCALQRGDGVGEVGRGRVVGDRRDLGRMVGKGPLERRQEMLRRDLGKGRRLERRLPRRQQRVGFRNGRILQGF